ncbi:MAG: glycosyltransferase [Dongiaceae bacterium]
MIMLDIVVCTYNRAHSLDAVLTKLGQLTPCEGIGCRVLVVDNASTDTTASVVDAHQRRGVLTHLRRVFAAERGLTAARLRGVRETAAPWIAFVDDDNFLATTWLHAVGEAIASHAGAGGIGGKVVLEWEIPPPRYLEEFGFCFAAQDHGDADCVVDSLAGAGMVLRRSALDESGWINRPLIADRIGRKLTSGGDVEMAQRVRAAGYELWFTPSAVLHHRIPANRMSRQYLFRINRELGASSALLGLLTYEGDWATWQHDSRAQKRHWYALAARGLRYALIRRKGLTSALAWSCFASGFARGIRQCETLDGARRAELLGAAALSQHQTISRCGSVGR